MFPPIGFGKDTKKGSGFGKFEVLLQLNEQLRTASAAPAAVPAK